MPFNEIGVLYFNISTLALSLHFCPSIKVLLPFHENAPALPSKYFELQDILQYFKFIPGMLLTTCYHNIIMAAKRFPAPYSLIFRYMQESWTILKTISKIMRFVYRLFVKCFFFLVLIQCLE